MADIEIVLDPPSDGEPFTINAILDNEMFTFDFRYWPRLKRWLINAYRGFSIPVMMSIPGEVGYPLFRDCSSPNKPLGKLLLVDTSGTGLPPGPKDLGARVKIRYRPVGDS